MACETGCRGTSMGPLDSAVGFVDVGQRGNRIGGELVENWTGHPSMTIPFPVFVLVLALGGRSCAELKLAPKYVSPAGRSWPRISPIGVRRAVEREVPLTTGEIVDVGLP